MKLTSRSLTLFVAVISAALLCLVFALCPGAVDAQDKVALKEVTIAGNVRVEEDGIRLHLKNRPGTLFDSALVEQDVKAIYRMGFFDDVQAELSADGVLTYRVKEKPYVREVKVQGNSQVARDKIETALGVGARTILDRPKLAEGVEKIRKLYTEQGYVNARIDHAVSLEPNNQAVVVVDINEGSKLLIKKVTFEGNRAFSDSELRGLIATKEEWLFTFITNRGVLDRDMLTNDIAILSTHYYDNGYIDHQISEPVILRGRDGLEVVIRIKEGKQYRVGKVEIGGDMIVNGQELLKSIKLTTGQIFRGSRLREDIKLLTEIYTNSGFAFAEVEPVTKLNPPEQQVDVALLIKKGPPVYFNRILVAGNSKTRDKVVRRELLAGEQELFSGSKITQSKNALQRTGYFEDVQLTTKKSSQPDTVDLLVDVKEGPTGNFSLGAGYSSGDGFLFNASVAEKNFLGRGQGLNGSFSIGSSRQDFVVGFNDPYVYDTRIAMGVDAYNTKREYSDFDERKLGFGVNTSYPLRYLRFPFFSRAKDQTPGSDEIANNRAPTMWDYMRGGVGYELTRDKIDGISSTASDAIKNEAGTTLTSSVTPNMSYDSRDHFFNPTEGSKSALSIKFAGLGGDSRFIKSDLSARWHYPLLKDPNWGGTYVLALGGSLGYGIGFDDSSNSGSDLPLFERYFIGGINSIRGFSDRSLGPRVRNCTTTVAGVGTTDCTYGDLLGGDKAAVVNAELLFPIAEQYGLRGVAFFDLGNSFGVSCATTSSTPNFDPATDTTTVTKSDCVNTGFKLSDLRKSVGVGARWLSPFGPLRVELGFALNKRPGDETSLLGFTIGSQP
ncbi:MAG TPA: outer membrane protein assembly factor BamA [Candidatus Binatia bacterium]|nr:outer membrane protein assembly factor BamA [Candidatus Binatia bacterium]